MAPYAGPLSCHLEPDIDNAWMFLQWWFEHCTKGAIEIGWMMPSVGQLTSFRRFDIGDMSILKVIAAENSVPGQAMYVRACTIDPHSPLGRTRDEHVIQAPGAWDDLDTEEQVRLARLVVSMVRANGFTRTGRIPHDRYQVFLRCTEPIEDLDMIRLLNRKAYRLYGGDPTVANPSRLMRLPGTIAWPYKPGRVPEMTRFEPAPADRPSAYPLATLLAQLPKVEGESGFTAVNNHANNNTANASYARPGVDADEWGPGPGVGAQSFSGISRVADLIRTIQAGHHWHNNALALIAHWVGTGWCDAEILVAAPGLTLAGYTVAVTEAEMRVMIDGARKKWAVPDPSTAVLNVDWSPPVDIFENDDTTPELHAKHIPEALWPFVHDTAERMGVEPFSVALACLVSCAAVMPDTWQLQPKLHDTSWTENPRLWGAIVGPPSIRKSPVIAAATRPIDNLDAKMRHQHRQAMEAHDAAHAAWKSSGDPAKGSEPRPPRLPRYLVEGTTIEALSEVLRDDPEAKQFAPSHKVLSPSFLRTRSVTS
jgi:hypothetical protein